MVTSERDMAETREVPEAPALSGERLTGYAVIYNTKSRLINDPPVSPEPFYEVVMPGAFDESMAKDNVTFVNKHNDDAEYGDTQSGNLKLKSDERGIAYDLAMPSYAHTMRGRIERGEYPGMSFMFRAQDVEWKGNVRYIRKAELKHISPVYRPAYATPQPKLEAAQPKTGNSLAKYKAKAKAMNF